MDNNIQVSVYCLAYNHEKYIRKTLEGFVMQKTNFNYEVIVHDDASTDKTPEIIREYAEKYPDIIKPILQEKNQYSQNINFIDLYVIPAMHGKYFASCEGDDYWTDPYKLQKQYDALETHPECSLSTHRVECCNEDGSYNERVIPSVGIGLDQDCILSQDKFAEYIWKNGYIFHTSCYFFRREIWDIPIELARDEGIIRKCLIAGGVYYIEKPMSVRRLGAIDSFNSRLKAQGFSGNMRLMQSNFDNDVKFDKYTNFKYDALIRPTLLMNVLGWAFYDPENAKKTIIDNSLQLKNVWKYLDGNQKTKAIIKYPLLWICPKVLKYIILKKNSLS